MRLADRPVPKRNDEIECGEDRLCFTNAEEGARRFLQAHCAGKTLVVSDVGGYKALAGVAVMPKSVSLVYDGDALALFSMPDGVGCVLASGGEDVLRAARYFAHVRSVPCALFPSSGTLCGAFETRGKIALMGEEREVPLADANVYFDLNNGFSLSEAYTHVYLTALARFEEDALAAFRGERAVKRPPITLCISCPDRADLVALNADLRRAEPYGAAGEGDLLARLYRRDGNRRPVYRAFTELLALYYAFFKCGKPRKYFVCDYAARAKTAGKPYYAAGVPTPQEYASRALVLERIRSQKIFELKEILTSWRQSPFCMKQAASLLDLNNLKYLPEHGGGLSAVIRDFGLLG